MSRHFHTSSSRDASLFDSRTMKSPFLYRRNPVDVENTSDLSRREVFFSGHMSRVFVYFMHNEQIRSQSDPSRWSDHPVIMFRRDQMNVISCIQCTIWDLASWIDSKRRRDKNIFQSYRSNYVMYVIPWSLSRSASTSCRVLDEDKTALTDLHQEFETCAFSMLSKIISSQVRVV